MKRIDLDFCAAQSRAHWIGRGLLAVAALVCLDAGLSYSSLHRSVAETRARLEQRGAPAVAAKASAQEVALARDTVQRLALPWGSLFGALESAASDDVALVAIEPDTRAGTVVISGDSKDYLAALSYVLNLSQAEGLDNVQLVRHEQKVHGGPVSFAASAAWNAK